MEKEGTKGLNVVVFTTSPGATLSPVAAAFIACCCVASSSIVALRVGAERETVGAVALKGGASTRATSETIHDASGAVADFSAVTRGELKAEVMRWCVGRWGEGEREGAKQRN